MFFMGVCVCVCYILCKVTWSVRKELDKNKNLMNK